MFKCGNKLSKIFIIIVVGFWRPAERTVSADIPWICHGNYNHAVGLVTLQPLHYLDMSQGREKQINKNQTIMRKIPTPVGESSLHFPTRFTDRWCTTVLLNAVDKVIFVRGSGNVSRASAEGEAIVAIQKNPAAFKRLLYRRIPPEMLTLPFSFSLIVA